MICKHVFCCLGTIQSVYLELLALRSGVLSSPSSKSMAVLEVLVDCGGVAVDIAHLVKQASKLA